jgi:F-type H+-transporting ATPase subunit c
VESIGTLNMVGLGLAAIGPGIARQPEAEGKLRQIAILGFVLAEQFFIIGLALAFVLKSSNT